MKIVHIGAKVVSDGFIGVIRDMSGIELRANGIVRPFRREAMDDALAIAKRNGWEVQHLNV